MSCLPQAGGLQPKLKLDELPKEALVYVFQYLCRKSLCRVAQVCHYFNELASLNGLWKRWAKDCIMTSLQHGLDFTNRTALKERCRVSRRWELGRCKVKNVLRFKTNFLPWLCFNPDHSKLYLAVGDTVKQLPLNCWDNGTGCESTTSGICDPVSIVHKGLDVCRFSVSGDYIVTGGWYGRLACGRPDDLSFVLHENAHESDIGDVALLGDVIVSGSRDQTVKIWRICDNGRKVNLLSKEVIHRSVLSVAVNSFKRIFAVGTGGVGGVHPLQIKDLNSGKHMFSLGESYKNGAGVLDCHFQSPDLLMSTGYDTYVRLWDTRVRRSACVRAWEEPHDNTVYCVASDDRFGFVSGSCRHGVVRLWDTRMSKCLQTFYLGGKVSSPVYTLRFTHSRLFAGLARGVFCLDFG